MSRIVTCDDMWNECSKVAKSYPDRSVNNVVVASRDFPGGRIDRYITKHFEVKKRVIPVMLINKQLFMSITPMEVESHINPIKWSHGHVLIGGLGMGYIVNQIKDKPSVKSVTVVEREQAVIDYYLEVFGKHPRVKIIKADIFKFKRKRVYDYAYVDIWPSMDLEQAASDMKRIFDNGDGNLSAKSASFWGIEKWILGNYHEHDNLLGLQFELGFRFTAEMMKDTARLLGDLERSEFR